MNPFDLLKNFKDAQGKASEMKENLKKITAIGSSGGGMVVIELNGAMELLRVNIDKVAIETNDVRFLEDLIFSAFSQGMQEIKQKIQEETTNLLPGGIDIINNLMNGGFGN